MVSVIHASLGRVLPELGHGQHILCGGPGHAPPHEAAHIDQSNKTTAMTRLSELDFAHTHLRPNSKLGLGPSGIQYLHGISLAPASRAIYVYYYRNYII
jgi:hypothetical protein